MKLFMPPAMTMAGALSVTPVGPYLRPSVRTYVTPNHIRSLSQIVLMINQNVMKLGHIVKYHNVCFMFDNGPYCTMPSGVLALCL